MNHPDRVLAHDACEAQMHAAFRRYNVPLGILYAVGLTETGHKDSLQPYALNIDGRAVFARSENEALRIIADARRQGARLIDIGCMQINEYYHREHFDSLRSMISPAKNVDYAARFLRALYEREGDWTKAVARYHAGPNNNRAQKRYVCRVMHNMVASGFGKWTRKAREFCQKNN